MSTLRTDQLQTTDSSFTINVADLITNVSLNTIPYLASGTGAVSRSTYSKLSDMISAKDYGAKGDFATDDTTAIRNALTAAAAYGTRGAVVYLPAGIYNVSGGLVVPPYVTLMGAGKASTLIRCTVAGTVVDPILSMPNNFSQLRGVGVVYSGLQTTQGTCLRSTGSNNSLSDFMVSAGQTGFHWHTGSATICSDFQILDCKSVGLLIGQSITGFSNDLFLSNFFIITNDQTNFILGSVRVVGRVEALILEAADFIGGNTVFTSDPGATQGLRFSAFSKIYFDSAATTPVFNGLNHTSFTDCWWSNRAGGGTFVNCHSLTLTGAKAYNNSLHAMQFNNCHHITLAGDFSFNNLSSTASVDDIFFDSACNNLTIGPIVGVDAGVTRYGIFISAGVTNYQVSGINMTARASGVLSEPTTAPSRKVTGVSGYVTQSRGSGSLPASATTTTVAHGLAFVPTLASLHLVPNGQSATPLFIASADAVNITVGTQTANAGATPFSWSADVS